MAPCKNCICLAMCRNRLRSFRAINCSMMAKYIAVRDKDEYKKRYTEVRYFLSYQPSGINVSIIMCDQKNNNIGRLMSKYGVI